MQDPGSMSDSGSAIRDAGLAIRDQGFFRAARSSRRFNSAPYASAAARLPRIHPITTPINRTAGMKMKCADVIWPKSMALLLSCSDAPAYRLHFVLDPVQPRVDRPHVAEQQ